MGVREKWNLTKQLLRGPLVPEYAKASVHQYSSAVLAVPFNCYLRGDPPDASNRRIAEIAADYCREYRLPFFGQFEHTSLLADWLEPEKIDEFGTSDGERVQSQNLVRWQASKVRSLRMGEQVTVVGMPEHLGRVVALLRYYGLNPVVAEESATTPYDPSDRPGAQSWCKERDTFARYERRVARPGTVGKLWLGLI